MFKWIKQKVIQFKKWFIGLFIVATALAAGVGTIPLDTTNTATPPIIITTPTTTPIVILPIEERLKNKTHREKVEIKSFEIIDKVSIGIFDRNNLIIHIQKIEQIDGGIQLFAQAWKNGKQLGFGKDGTIDIERFRIYNPPVLVDDLKGTIIREWVEIDRINNRQVKHKRTLREDPKEALLQSLEHTIGLVGKENTQIIKGKIGNTTSTFYPDSGNPGTTSVDGAIRNNGAVFATVHDATSGASLDPIVNEIEVVNSFITSTYYIDRSLINFDTSALPDIDTIDSATLSVKHDSAGFANADTDSMSLVTNSIVSNVAYALADYDLFSTTKQATDILLSALSNGVYSDFTLNATGLTNISKTSVSHFGIRNTSDISNTAPTGDNQARFYGAETIGTTSDPKLVVVHSAVATTVNRPNVIWFK